MRARITNPVSATTGEMLGDVVNLINGTPLSKASVMFSEGVAPAVNAVQVLGGAIYIPVGDSTVVFGPTDATATIRRGEILLNLPNPLVSHPASPAMGAYGTASCAANFVHAPGTLTIDVWVAPVGVAISWLIPGVALASTIWMRRPRPLALKGMVSGLHMIADSMAVSPAGPIGQAYDYAPGSASIAFTGYPFISNPAVKCYDGTGYSVKPSPVYTCHSGYVDTLDNSVFHLPAPCSVADVHIVNGVELRGFGLGTTAGLLLKS